MSGKVNITKEQAEAINKLGWQGFKESEILTLKFRKLDFQVDTESSYLIIKHMDLDALVKALYVGYEVEKSPEELVLEFYRYELKDHNTEAYSAISSTLDLLGIEIEGVNK